MNTTTTTTTTPTTATRAKTTTATVHVLTCVFYQLHSLLILLRTEFGAGIYWNLKGTWWPNGSRRDCTDVSESQASNQCLCGVWARSQLAALDMLHRIKVIFGAGHVSVVFSGYSGFLHHQKKSYSLSVLNRRDTVAAVLSPGRVARISQGNLLRKCYKIHIQNSG
jgi:hypothetical protein